MNQPDFLGLWKRELIEVFSSEPLSLSLSQTTPIPKCWDYYYYKLPLLVVLLVHAVILTLQNHLHLLCFSNVAFLLLRPKSQMVLLSNTWRTMLTKPLFKPPPQSPLTGPAYAIHLVQLLLPFIWYFTILLFVLFDIMEIIFVKGRAFSWTYIRLWACQTPQRNYQGSLFYSVFRVFISQVLSFAIVAEFPLFANLKKALAEI